MFNCKYETRYGDYKDFYTIKPSAILDIIQDVSTKNSASCGYDMHKLKDMGFAWLLKGTNLHFKKKVSTANSIDVYTAVKPLKGATSERGCILKQNGEIVAKSIAEWFLFDVQKLKPVRVPKEMMELYQISDFDNDEFFKYKKPVIFEDAKVCSEIKIANKDIDTNKHLNNQKAAEILMDALPFDFYFNDIKLLYKNPAFLGDILDVCVKETPNGYYVHIQTKEKEICVAGSFENL